MSKEIPATDDPNRIEHHFKEFCKQNGLDLENMHPHELQERKIVFWAAWGQCQIQLLANLLNGHEPKDVVNQARDQVRQVSEFFQNLTPEG